MLTPAQLDNARAVREELQLMFDRASELAAAETVLAQHCELCGVPRVNGTLCATFGRVQLEIAEAMDAYDELLAASAVAAGAAESPDTLKKPAEVKRAAPALVAA